MTTQKRKVHKRDVFVLVTTLFLFWILLTVNFSIFFLIFGFSISLGIGLIATRLTLASVEGKRKTLKQYFFATEHLFGLIFSAIFRIIIANIELIYQVLTLDIDPKIVRIKVNLSSDAELTLISHLITLTPGTLVIDVDDANKKGESYLFVHFSYYDLAEEDFAEKIEKSIESWDKTIGALFK
jgi:multicomponent Na+:H+ antiporter subunit E